MSDFPPSFGRGNIFSGGPSKNSTTTDPSKPPRSIQPTSSTGLAEEIMNATMEGARNALEPSKTSGDTSDISFDTHYYCDTETSEEEYSTMTTDTEIEAPPPPSRGLLPSEQPLIPFVPARLKKGERAMITPEIQALLNAAGVQPNPKYEGEITAEVLNDLLTPAQENCALHITNIHPKAEMADLFSTIHHGKVYSVAWNAPNEEWTHAAARLCFCAREAAERYLADGGTGDGIQILGQRITVEWNRNRKCPVPEDESHQSRVVQLRGPRSFGFSAQDLLDFFGKDMKLFIISRKEWDHKTDQKVVELAFCGIKAQSRMAFRCFKQKVAAQGLGEQFDIRFAADPCDPSAAQGRDMFMPRPRTRQVTPPPPPPPQPRTLDSIRTSSWRSGTFSGPNRNGNTNSAQRAGPKYEKGTGPDAKYWRRTE
ncbi:uncharacterized protein EAE98_010681 [Botrytis deweyae]|uniref:RRM domain-containing protein n=1 Tax=Botrytis deweyae TaxID=2478750 RepID=A0ABQ7I7Z5_9HELO|nr:uncharacterized protein EAE98_010681 [Botrytis deweyae]KAF7916381.1 hypothetical protein EAE98_010681 [Botrytis deweyae]